MSFKKMNAEEKQLQSLTRLNINKTIQSTAIVHEDKWHRFFTVQILSSLAVVVVNVIVVAVGLLLLLLLLLLLMLLMLLMLLLLLL